MRVRMKGRRSLIIGLAALVAAAANLACSSSADGTSSFQPVAFGARPWSPPAGWDPEPACVVGYYIAVETCNGCSGISYALCVGNSFTQCTCGGPSWPGAMCPANLACSSDDFPPENWMEFTDYAGPGRAGQ
jgi:hypothetical protein